MILLIIILLLNHNLIIGSTLKGFVIDKYSNIFLTNISIIIYNNEITYKTKTDNNGYFFVELENLINENIYIELIDKNSFLLYKTNIFLKNNNIIKFEIDYNKTIELEEIKIKKQKIKFFTSKNYIKKEESEKLIRNGLNDIVSTYLLMPGIESISLDNSTPESGVSKMSVRGGNWFENSALIDDFIINKAYHSYFPNSVFIEGLVESISLYKGVISP